MTTAQYLAALEKLDLHPTGKYTAAVLGQSVRQLARLKAGYQPVPAVLALLIAAYLRHGLPPE